LGKKGRNLYFEIKVGYLAENLQVVEDEHSKIINEVKNPKFSKMGSS
tara:strand:- start:163 stop:303 length:141 start_codon:yes stop_codon:yes gene_type:complete